jgi:hypothetical protein
LTECVVRAFKRVYLEYKDAIITCFKNVGLFLAVDSSKDHLLKVQDYPNLAFSDWYLEPKTLGIEGEPILINNNNVRDMIKVDDDDNSLLYTAREVTKGITVKVEDENNIITDLRVSSDKRFNPDS